MYFSTTTTIQKAAAQRQVIAFAMNEYQMKTCIRFVARTSETDYIQIMKTGQGYLNVPLEEILP